MQRIKNLIWLVLSLSIMIACSTPQEKKAAQIKSLEDELFADETNIDREKSAELIKAYIAYSDEFPEDVNAANNLFKAADMSMNMNRPHQAIQLFNRILKDYPDFEKAPQCLFLKGYVHENNLNDLETARKIYTEFLEKYPDNDFADDAEVSIKNLGKTPEELIKEFEEQAKAQQNI
jgi:outer membrane protein assembly factor BamD (BamD/ComL family)